MLKNVRHIFKDFADELICVIGLLSSKINPRCFVSVCVLLTFLLSERAYALSSNNVPLDSPVYLYLEKLAGFGLINSDVKGIRPFSKAEVARLLAEAEERYETLPHRDDDFARLFLQRLHDLISREVALREVPTSAPFFDYNPLSLAKLRFAYLHGKPRSFVRDVHDAAHQSAFGFIGGDLRPLGGGGTVHTTGTEGTPLFENNEGVIYDNDKNLELRWGLDAYVADKVSAFLEPTFLHTLAADHVSLHAGYLKIGGGGAELEVGRDANWFGPGYRGALTLSNNAQNFDLIKISSPEPLGVDFVKKYLGELKYSLIFSRFDKSGEGTEFRQPYFFGLKLSLKPKPWVEVGASMVRQQGGPGFSGNVPLKDQIFGGGNNDHINSIAGVDLRFRIPCLNNIEIFGEYAGEDSAGFWPIVESYVAGFYIPRLTADGRNDLRFEYYWGSVMAYGDWQFPAGYVYHDLTPGHSQGGAAQDFFIRYSHWFSVRNNLALEFFHTDRGKQGKIAGQSTEYKNAWRVFWSLPAYGDIDLNFMYGFEHINNLNLMAGEERSNQLFKMDISYRY